MSRAVTNDSLLLYLLIEAWVSYRLMHVHVHERPRIVNQFKIRPLTSLPVAGSRTVQLPSAILNKVIGGGRTTGLGSILTGSRRGGRVFFGSAWKEKVTLRQNCVTQRLSHLGQGCPMSAQAVIHGSPV